MGRVGVGWEFEGWGLARGGAGWRRFEVGVRGVGVGEWERGVGAVWDGR